MSDFKPIETQEEFDRVIQERLHRQEETLLERYSDYEQLKTRNAELESQVGSLQAIVEKSKGSETEYSTKLNELTEKIAGYETANLRTKIALQNGLPFDLADRLVGTDEASIKADAERLAAFVGNNVSAPPLRSTEPKVLDGKEGAYKSLIEGLSSGGE